MKELTGTEKQIAWAEKLRANFVKNAGAALNELRNETKTPNPEAFKMVEDAIEYLANQSRAGFWIENEQAYKLRTVAQVKIELLIRVKRFKETGSFKTAK